MPAAIFLDTSIQTHRVLVDRTEQEPFEASLRALSPNLHASNYVWMEYQRTVIADIENKGIAYRLADTFLDTCLCFSRSNWLRSHCVGHTTAKR